MAVVAVPTPLAESGENEHPILRARLKRSATRPASKFAELVHELRMQRHLSLCEIDVP